MAAWDAAGAARGEAAGRAEEAEEVEATETAAMGTATASKAAPPIAMAAHQKERFPGACLLKAMRCSQNR